jgi:hypothetical protein
MPADPVTAGLDLASTLLNLAAPSISAEQKLSRLDAYKQRIQAIQQAGTFLAVTPGSRGYQLDVRDVSVRLLNAAGLTAPGLASVDVSVPLDDYEQLLTCAALVALLLEDSAVGGQPVKA